RLVRHVFSCRNVGIRFLKGFDKPQLLYELQQEKEGQRRGFTSYHIITPFIGRDSDLAAALRFITPRESNGGLLIITGEAGVGKSRFLAELKSQATETQRWF